MSPSTFRSGKLAVSVLAIAMLSLVYSTARAQSCFVNPRIKKITANVSATIKSYLEFKPVDWNTNPTKKYALIVYIGGTGEMFQQPGGTDQSLCPAIQYSLPWRANVGHFPDFVTDPNTGQQHSYLVVMPFVTAWEQQYQVDPGAMIDYAIQAYPNRIDLSRIYLTGMSRGTDNLMGYATSSLTAANRIAAIVPVGNCFPDYTGSGNMTLFNTQVGHLANGNVRLWGISCQGDKVCTENYIKNWVAALNVQKPGNGVFSFATRDCDTAAPNGSFHYAWNQAYDPDYRPAASGGKNVYEWMIQFSKGGSNPPPPPPTSNCSTISVIPSTSSLKVKGLIAPVATVQIFNNSWATIFNQTFTNSPDSITVSNLPQGVYHLKVSFYSSSWSPICDRMIDATVGNAPPPPPPPPPTGGGNCSTIVITATTSGVRLTGISAPVAAVQIFRSNWTTAFNQVYTNSPGTVNVPLSNGSYIVKVAFNNANWTNICEKLQDVVVPGTTTGAAIDFTTRTAGTPATEQVIIADPTVLKRMTVAPNPFSNAMRVTIGSDKNENATITVMDLAGRIVYKKAVTLQKGVNTIPLTGLGNFKAGSYWLRLITSDGVENLRLLKQ